MRILIRPLALAALLATLSVSAFAATDWQAKVREQLPLLGHRNWIVIVDSAYPWQTAPGIETVDTGADHLAVTEAVLAELAKVTHVKPAIYVDSELAKVAEKNAKGITAYRTALASLLKDKASTALPHEQIIAKLDEAGKTFHVLVLKTTQTLPYTSVFLQLECGYWNAESEKELRNAMKQQ